MTTKPVGQTEPGYRRGRKFLFRASQCGPLMGSLLSRRVFFCFLFFLFFFTVYAIHVGLMNSQASCLFSLSLSRSMTLMKNLWLRLGSTGPYWQPAVRVEGGELTPPLSSAAPLSGTPALGSLTKRIAF